MDHDDLVAHARTAVDRAGAGLLTAQGRCPGRPATAAVDVGARADGDVDLLLPRDHPAVRRLLARPLASLQLAPHGGAPVLLTGVVRRVPGRARPHGQLAFVLQVARVRLGAHLSPVDVGRYALAEPAPPEPSPLPLRPGAAGGAVPPARQAS